MTRRKLLIAIPAGVLTQACRRNKEGELAEVVNAADPAHAPQLLRGFHSIEENSWRWTQSTFAVALKPPKKVTNGAVLFLKYSIPEAVLSKVRETTLSASVDGIPLQPEKIPQAGMLEYRREVPADALRGKTGVTVEFTVVPFLPPSDSDKRELGLIIHSVGLVRK